MTNKSHAYLSLEALYTQCGVYVSIPSDYWLTTTIPQQQLRVKKNEYIYAYGLQLEEEEEEEDQIAFHQETNTHQLGKERKKTAPPFW